MVSEAHRKLREAAFFLAHVEHEIEKAKSIQSEASEFYLSAFLSAARSVTFVLEAEAPHQYQEWSPTWRASLTDDERALLASFTAARNRALKREAPLLTERWDESAMRDPRALPFFLEDYIPPLPSRTLVGRLTPEAALQEVMPSCREYFGLLQRLVEAFSRAHTS